MYTALIVRVSTVYIVYTDILNRVKDDYDEQ